MILIYLDVIKVTINNEAFNRNPFLIILELDKRKGDNLTGKQMLKEGSTEVRYRGIETLLERY